MTPFYQLHNRPATIFFVKKPKIFENVKTERVTANFQKSWTPRASTIQKFSDLGHKNMLAGSIITISMKHNHFCLLIMNQKLIKISNMSKLALLLRTICKTGIQAKTIC